MSRAIEIIDPEGERRSVIRRRFLVLAIAASLTVFGYPVMRDYAAKWSALRAGRGFVEFLSALKTRSILSKKPMEARFYPPERVDVFETSSCGPFAERVRVSETKLSDFAAGIEFASEEWVKDVVGTHEAYLKRFCFDPLFGSSVLADGLAHGAVFLAHHADLSAKRSDHVVSIVVEGPGGDLSLE
jgi:hypothetical protein